jgi:hypothetical protein
MKKSLNKKFLTHDIQDFQKIYCLVEKSVKAPNK